MRKLFISLIVVIGLVIGLITLWFWPNIQGHYRFKEYCAQEGGLRVNGKVLPDQGWLAAGTDPYHYRTPFYLGKVAFVRFQDKNGERFDVYAKPNPWPKSPDYILQPVDESKTPKYMLKYVNESIPNELRLGRNQMMVLSAQTKEVIISYTDVVYSQFDQNKTLLGAPSTVTCPRLYTTDKEITNLIYN
jgi:hypothetical protein